MSATGACAPKNEGPPLNARKGPKKVEFDPYTEGYWSQTLAEALCDQVGLNNVAVDLNSVMKLLIFCSFGKKNTYLFVE